MFCKKKKGIADAYKVYCIKRERNIRDILSSIDNNVFFIIEKKSNQQRRRLKL